MRIGFVINPISGGAGWRHDTGRARRDVAEAGAREAGVDAEIALTDRQGHATELARGFVARGLDVIAWGGDGTINETAGPLIGTRATLGIVPSGSGDGLARGLRLPRAIDDALRLAMTGTACAIDVGYLGGRHFLNIAGIGLDAAIAGAFNERTKRGLSGYVSVGLRFFWSYTSETYRVELHNESREGRRLIVGFANSREYGHGMVLAPDADPSDGWLDMVVVDGGSPVRQIWRARRLAFLRRRPAQGVTRARVQSARITGDRLRCHVDGETFTTSGTVDVSIVPRALRIRTGRG
jgi:YegS/Rv2252/BmrU family lipid kinase